MKKPRPKRSPPPPVGPDDILPEYDFSRGRRNKYAKHFRAGSQIVVVEPDLATLFPDAQAVNEALRALAGIIRRQPRAKNGSRTTRRSARRSA